MWFGRSSAEGTRVEAPKAPTGVGSGEGVSPSPVGVGSGEGAPQKKTGMFSLEMVHFDAFWSMFRPTITATTMFMTCRDLGCILLLSSFV